MKLVGRFSTFCDPSYELSYVYDTSSSTYERKAKTTSFQTVLLTVLRNSASSDATDERETRVLNLVTE